MSYKLDLSDLDRDGDVSITQQLVDRFSAAIEAGELEPGAKLPPTRELAAEAGVNHLTAARVYRKLAELGYVTAQVGRGTFVRTLAPAGSAAHGDDWQVYALPPDDISYSEQVLADTFSLRGPRGHDLARRRLAGAEHLPDRRSWRAIAADVFEEVGGEALSYLPAEGLFELREQLAARGRTATAGPRTRTRSSITSGAQQAIALAARATLEPGDVAVVESPTFIGMMTALRGTGARVIGVPVDEDGLDVDALERLLARHEVKLVGLQSACQNPTGRNLSEERRPRLAELAVERNFFVLEDRVYADMHFDGQLVRPGARARARRTSSTSTRCRRWWAAVCAAGWVAARGAGARADRDAQARGGLPLAHADPAHRGALARHRRLRPPRGAARSPSTASAATR